MFKFPAKRVVVHLLWMTCCFSTQLWAQAPEGQETSSRVASSLRPGKTTLEEAQGVWEATNASTISRGKLAIGGGSGVDRMSKVALDQVDLIDQRGVDFEGLPVARYAFVDGTLYAITAQLDQGLQRSRGEFKQLSADELDTLQKELSRKYGPPNKVAKDMFAGKRPNIFIWNLRENELVLQVRPGLGSSLTMQNKALAQKVESYRKTECKKHRPNPATPGSITEVCV